LLLHHACMVLFVLVETDFFGVGCVVVFFSLVAFL